MCTLSIMPGHERLKVGAVASVLRKQPRRRNSPCADWTPVARTMISNSLPQKEFDSSSMNSTPIEKEPVMECPLLLTTL